MPDQRLLDIAKYSLDQTRLGLMKWEEYGHLTYVGEKATAAVMIESVDDDGVQPYRFSVLRSDDSSGYEVLDSFEQGYDRDGDSFSYPELAELYDLGRKSALQIDPILSGLLEELRNEIAELPPVTE